MLPFWLYFAFSALAIGVWYWCSRQSSRNRAVLVLHWLERALAGGGHVAGLRWVTPSQFEVSVRMSNALFRDAKVMVRMKRTEFPLTWLMERLRQSAAETLTFTADLDMAPGFSLELRNMRWFARSQKNISPKAGRWQVDTAGPIALTTRKDWQSGIAQVMQNMINCENREMVDLAFSRSSPHFRATLPLTCISPDHVSDTRFFDALRDIASGTSSSTAA